MQGRKDATEPLQRHVRELLGHLERNQEALVHYAARRRRGEPISTAFVESAVNETVARRMNKKQQMRWNRTTVQPFLDVRTAVLDGTLEEAFRRRHHGFRPASDERTTAVAAYRDQARRGLFAYVEGFYNRAGCTRARATEHPPRLGGEQ
ncbi:MAG: hypothetical protein JO143_02700 [Acetobacteraceae bacterium]|nr:hypothetical protein [Acetobacteraceae bacterium]